jgi:uncharacterized protein YdbL (DUF1318 family)
MNIVTSIRSMIGGLLLMLALPVFAMSLQQAMSALDSAKAQGVVGEQPNGYLGVVSNANNSSDIVKLINDARRAEYERLAKTNNISIKDVETLAGQKAIERTEKGNFIELNGKWIKKP